MHEVAIMQQVVQSLLTTLKHSGATRVTRVQMTMGTSERFAEETVLQYFQALTQQTPIEGATLTIAWLPATFQCLSCLHRFEKLVSGQVHCPLCGNLALEFEHQHTCTIDAIDVIFEEGGLT